MLTAEQWESLEIGDRLSLTHYEKDELDNFLPVVTEYWILIREENYVWLAVDAVDGQFGSLDIKDDLQIIPRFATLNIELTRD